MEYFDWDYIYKNIILNSEDDKILLNYINLFKNGVIELVIDKDTKIHTLNWIKISLDYSPPKLSLVNKIIKIELEKSEVLDEEFLRILERNRKMYITKGSKNSMEFKDQYDLENWIA